MRIKAIIVSFLAFTAVMFGLSAPANATTAKLSSFIDVSHVSVRSHGSVRTAVVSGRVETLAAVPRVDGTITLKVNGVVYETTTVGPRGEFWVSIYDMRIFGRNGAYFVISYGGNSKIKPSTTTELVRTYKG